MASDLAARPMFAWPHCLWLRPAADTEPRGVKLRHQVRADLSILEGPGHPVIVLLQIGQKLPVTRVVFGFKQLQERVNLKVT